MTDNREDFQQEYLAGKEAFERGDYRQSILHLELAKGSVNLTSRVGGEIQMWLVTAYQASGNVKAAVSLCQQLLSHPNPLIRKQAQRVIYIIEAPQLKRPKEWMSEIPDLNDVSEEGASLLAAKPRNSNNFRNKKETEPEIDPSEIETKDNQFIWVALTTIIAVFIGLFYFSNH